MKTTKTKFHFPLPILVGEGKLILDAGTAHPEIGGRLDKTYLADTATVLDSVKTQATDHKGVSPEWRIELDTPTISTRGAKKK